MNEKRFEVINVRWQGKGEAVAFEDTQTNQVYFAENQEECKRIVDLLNELSEENEQLKEEIRAYPINEQYAEEIMQQNQKLRIERNDLRRENEKLRNFIDLMNMRQKWKLYNYKRDNDSEKNCKVEVGENVKRFEVDVDHLLLVWDTEKNKRLEIEDIVNLLNEFVTKCHSLKKEIEQLKERVIVLEKLISDVETSEGMSIDNLIDTEMIRDE